MTDGYDLAQLLPALEHLWNTDRSRAEQALEVYLADTEHRGLEFTHTCLQSAKRRLLEGKSLKELD